MGSARTSDKLTVRAFVIGYFFVLAVLAGLAVCVAHRLQTRFRQPWLTPYTVFLVSWGAVGLHSVVQYILAWRAAPVWGQCR